jgi:hypothetical protein
MAEALTDEIEVIADQNLPTPETLDAQAGDKTKNK